MSRLCTNTGNDERRLPCFLSVVTGLLQIYFSRKERRRARPRTLVADPKEVREESWVSLSGVVEKEREKEREEEEEQKQLRPRANLPEDEPCLDKEKATEIRLKVRRDRR